MERIVFPSATMTWFNVPRWPSLNCFGALVTWSKSLLMNSREAQQGDQCGPGRSQATGAACRSGRHGACGLARRLRQADRRGNREVGQGDQVRRHQAAVKLLVARYSITSVPRTAYARLDRMS